MNLPNAYLEQMQQILGDEFSSFLASYDEPKGYGLRINPLKYALENSSSLPFSLSPVPWASEGFYADPEEQPGKHPLHEAGTYYIQEPSAMSAVALLNPLPGDIVCDLCAAPGGKSTQIAGRLAGEGLLVSNEIFPARAKILSQNVERLGIYNALVCNEDPKAISKHFHGFFDKILVDAPCSGEGMFRKNPEAIAEWSPEQVEICAERQQMILDCAHQMLKSNGVIVYSTCTFSLEENELMIKAFLSKYPEYHIESWDTVLPTDASLSHGIDLEGSLRLWPHKLRGEGHFVVRLRREDFDTATTKTKKKKSPKIDLEDWKTFSHSLLKISEKSALGTFLKQGRYQFFKDELYVIPAAMKSLEGIHVLRAGLHLGTRKKNRLEPSHALAKALCPSQVSRYIELSFEDAKKYLHGDAISCDISQKSWTLVCYQGQTLGWGKATNGTLKNHYPKGLRTMS